MAVNGSTPTGVWYWNSYYPWGWAPFHYGRWSHNPQRGWIWFPAKTWAPSWVTWRASEDYDIIAWQHCPGKFLRFLRRHPIQQAACGSWLRLDFPRVIIWLSKPRTLERWIFDPRCLNPLSAGNAFARDSVINNLAAAPDGSLSNWGPDYNRITHFNRKSVVRAELHDSPSLSAAGVIASRSSETPATVMVFRPQLVVGQPTLISANTPPLSNNSRAHRQILPLQLPMRLPADGCRSSSVSPGVSGSGHRPRHQASRHQDSRIGSSVPGYLFRNVSHYFSGYRSHRFPASFCIRILSWSAAHSFARITYNRFTVAAAHFFYFSGCSFHGSAFGGVQHLPGASSHHGASNRAHHGASNRAHHRPSTSSHHCPGAGANYNPGTSAPTIPATVPTTVRAIPTANPGTLPLSVTVPSFNNGFRFHSVFPSRILFRSRLNAQILNPSIPRQPFAPAGTGLLS